MYDYDSSSESWVQVGQDIDGEGESDYSGVSVAVSEDEIGRASCRERV